VENVKVAVWGFGAMGSGVVKMLLAKKGVEVTGVCDIAPNRIGKDIYELLKVDRADRTPVIVSGDITKVLAQNRADVCIIATDSFVEKIYDKLLLVLGKGVNIITTAEEMSYPRVKYPELSAKIDAAAKAAGCSVLGTGINPGFAMDLLAILLSAAMTNVESVKCRRVNSLSPFGPAVMEEMGVGITPEEYEKRVAQGLLSGHVGFAESVGMISDALGFGVDHFEQQMAPIITKVDRKSPYGAAGAGCVAGVDMKGLGRRNGNLLIEMEHPQQIEPESEGVNTGDYIELRGTPPVSMAINPEISGGFGTIAMSVNCIPQVINADPGLITMLDIPVPHAIMGDFRDMIRN